MLLAFRRDLSYVSHAVIPHLDNEHLSVIVSRGKLQFTVIAAYIAPSCVFDPHRLNAILRQHTAPHLLTGDFNAHSSTWGSVRTTARGTSLQAVADEFNLSVLNDGSPTFVRPNGCCSCLDVIFLSSLLVHHACWFVDIDCRGRDHFPTYTSISGICGGSTPPSPSCID